MFLSPKDINKENDFFENIDNISYIYIDYDTYKIPSLTHMENLSGICCQRNLLKCVPDLSDKIKELWIPENNLSNLPYISSNMTNISVDANHLNALQERLKLTNPYYIYYGNNYPRWLPYHNLINRFQK